jgi:purine nucleoside permease
MRRQFDAETAAWPQKIAQAGLGNLTQVAIRIPGLFPLHPAVTCVPGHAVCQVTVGMGEANAAASAAALALSDALDLAQTYFILGGIAGVSPLEGTLGSVALARYTVQVTLQHEIDAREMPAGFATGYIPYGAAEPGQYPTITYGTEVVELNAALRDRMYALAAGAGGGGGGGGGGTGTGSTLADSPTAARHRQRYAAGGSAYSAAAAGPSVLRCDVATSDVYYTGRLLSEAFAATVATWTNGTGRYCMTASEDGAVLGALVRAAVWGRVDMGRVVVMRTGGCIFFLELL